MLELIFDFIPKCCLLEGGLDYIVELRLIFHTMDLGTVGDVVVNRHRERVRLLKNHSHFFSKFYRVDTGSINILSIQEDFAFNSGAIDQVIHTIDAPQKGRLAAA